MKRLAIFFLISISLISILSIGLVRYTSPVLAAGLCPIGDYGFDTAQECNSGCVGGQCRADEGGVNRCCGLTITGGTCPSSTVSYGTAGTCSNSCQEGVCVADNENINRCCDTTAGTDGTHGAEPEEIDIIPVGEFSDLPFGKLLNYGAGAAVMLTVLLLIVGGYGVVTSSGDPEKLQTAKSQITAAIAGLLFILMSVIILDIIGSGILGIDLFK